MQNLPSYHPQHVKKDVNALENYSINGILLENPQKREGFLKTKRVISWENFVPAPCLCIYYLTILITLSQGPLTQRSPLLIRQR